MRKQCTIIPPTVQHQTLRVRARRTVWKAQRILDTQAGAVARNEPPRVALNDKNPERSATAARAMKLDFSASDLADEHELNDIVWIAIKGTTPPPSVHSLFAQ